MLAPAAAVRWPVVAALLLRVAERDAVGCDVLRAGVVQEVLMAEPQTMMEAFDEAMARLADMTAECHRWQERARLLRAEKNHHDSCNDCGCQHFEEREW